MVASSVVTGGAVVVLSAVVDPTPRPAEAASAVKAFIPISPIRVLDTRAEDGSPIASGTTRSLTIGGLPQVPAGAVGVALNVTAVDPTGNGFVSVWPGGTTQPETSNLNFVAGQNVPNLVTVGLGADGTIAIAASVDGGAEVVDVLVDVVGWYAAGFNPIDPQRVLDTRQPGQVTLAPGEIRNFSVRGVEGVPVTAGAVGLNVTATNPTEAGYLTIWPAGMPQPPTSTLNFDAGETVANAAISGVGANAEISIFNASGSTDVVVDLSGWFSLGFTAITPARVIDTRCGGEISVHAGETRTVKVTGVGDVPLEGVGAVALNVTVTGPDTDGYLTVWPTGPRPEISVLNFKANDTVANAVVTGVGNDGTISFYNPFGEVDVIIDITGWYAKSDTEGPQISDITLDRTTIDTSTSAQVVKVTAHVTDNLAGVRPDWWGYVYFSGPGNGSQAGSGSLVSGTSTDAIVRWEVTFPARLRPGRWTMTSIDLTDQTGNWGIAPALWPESDSIEVDQIGPGDDVPPVVESMSVSPSTIDTSHGPVEVTLAVRITDDRPGSGLGGNLGNFSFCEPGSSQSASFAAGSWSRVSGDDFDGTYRITTSIPHHAAPGTWGLCWYSIVDRAGNRIDLSPLQGAAKFTTSFTQSAPGDTTPAAVTTLMLDQTNISTSVHAAELSMTVTVTDDYGANSCPNFWFTNSSGRWMTLNAQSCTLISGTPTAGVYRWTANVPIYSESGVWQLQQMNISDSLGNYRFYDLEELKAAGISAVFENN